MSILSPKISIVTVCYNASEAIEKTIISILNQTYENIEYIVIDGASSDGTINIVNKYRDRIVKVISEPDCGIYDAMNKGIECATGEWINFMNAGDIFLNDKTISTVFENNAIRKDIEVIYGDVIFMTVNSNEVIERCKPIQFIKRGMPFCHQSSFVKRSNLKLFNLKYRICADYDMFYQIYFTKGETAFEYKKTNSFSVLNQKKHRLENLIIRSQNKDLRWFWDKLKYIIKFNVLKLSQ